MANTIITKNSATASAVPTSGDLVQGELAVNVTDKRLFTENSGGTVVELGTNPSQLNFADNAKAIFGDGSDLQIYHDGTHSIIKDAGVGFLKIGLSDQGTAIQNSAGNNLLVTSATDVSLRYNGSEKLATTSTGIDVTGTVVSDGMTASASTANYIGSITNNNGTDAGGGLYIQTRWNTSGNSVLSLKSNSGSNHVANFAGNGDISFFEDTGTTAKFYWDSSAESLGIGTSSPGAKLDVQGGRTYLQSSSGDQYVLRLTNPANVSGVFLGNPATNSFAVYTAGGTERMRIDSSGNLGIGTSSPTYKLQVQSGLYSILAGADSGAVSLTDATQKVMRFGVPHYTNAEEPVAGMFISNLSNENGIFIGGGTGVFNAATRISFYTAADTTTTSGTERLRITSSGNVGIGTSSPGSKLAVLGSANMAYFYDGSTSDLQFQVVSSRTVIGTTTPSSLVLKTNNVERATLDSAGNLLVGTTSTANPTTGGFLVRPGSETYIQIGGTLTSSQARAYFYNGNGYVGGIFTSGTSTSYVTSSDYRLKEDWQPMVGASERVKALKPVNFAWKVDGSRVDGFLAHEAQAVVPEAVTGTKDAVDAEGKPVYQGIDQSKLVPLLTAALQEALAQIESLTARVSALEGN